MGDMCVSILTQPFGWVQHARRRVICCLREFQSSPSLLAGCNGLPKKALEPLQVSILTQPFGWVQLKGLKQLAYKLKFQSSPSLLAGCNE